MNEQHETEATQQPQPEPASAQIADGFGRVWSEIKQIGRQVERETRKSGRVARLKLDVRSLEREQREVCERLGKAVYKARLAHGDGIALSEVEGYAGGVAALDALDQKLTAKRAEIEQLRAEGHPDEAPVEASETPETPEEVA